MLTRSSYQAIHAVTGVGLAMLCVACSDRPSTARITAPPSRPLLDQRPVTRVEVYVPPFTIPGYRRTELARCSGFDQLGQVNPWQKRTWVARNPSVVTITPQYISNDSGTTAVFTGGPTVGSTFVLCTVKGAEGGASKTDSAYFSNNTLPPVIISAAAGNPTTIPPGGERIFSFELHNWTGGGLNYFVNANGSITNTASRSVTVMGTGTVGSTATVSAHLTLTNTGLLDSSNQPWSSSDTASVQATIQPDPLYVSMTGDQTVCSAGTYQWQVNATGGTGSYAYQWSVYWVNTGTTEELGTAQTQSLSVAAWQGDFQLTATVNSGGATNSAMTYVFNNAGSGDC